MNDFKLFFKDRKNLTNFLVVVILILGLPIGVGLVRQEQVLQSRASTQPIQFVGNNIVQRNGQNVIVIPQVGQASVGIQLTSPLGPALMAENFSSNKETGLADITKASSQVAQNIKADVVPKALAYNYPDSQGCQMNPDGSGRVMSACSDTNGDTGHTYCQYNASGPNTVSPCQIEACACGGTAPVCNKCGGGSTGGPAPSGGGTANTCTGAQSWSSVDQQLQRAGYGGPYDHGSAEIAAYNNAACPSGSGTGGSTGGSSGNIPACDPSQVSMSVSPNPQHVTNPVTFNVSGSQGSTWTSDSFTGGVNCGDTSGGFWGSRNCNATTGGTFTWTHYWQNTAPNQVNIKGPQCSKSVSYSISGQSSSDLYVTPNTVQVGKQVTITATADTACSTSITDYGNSGPQQSAGLSNCSNSLYTCGGAANNPEGDGNPCYWRWTCNVSNNPGTYTANWTSQYNTSACTANSVSFQVVPTPAPSTPPTQTVTLCGQTMTWSDVDQQLLGAGANPAILDHGTVESQAYINKACPAPVVTSTPTPAPTTATICNQTKSWDQFDTDLRNAGYTGALDHSFQEALAYQNQFCPATQSPSPLGPINLWDPQTLPYPPAVTPQVDTTGCAGESQPYVYLQWQPANPNSSNPVTYQIFRDNTQIGTTNNATQFLDANVASGTHEYHVTGSNSQGSVSSNPWNINVSTCTSTQSSPPNTQSSTPPITTPPTSAPSAPPVTTVSYQMAEDILKLDSAQKLPYNSDPVIVQYTFADQTPGLKTVFVRFYDSNGKASDIEQQSILLVPQDPTITGVTCNVDITGQGMTVKVDGANFGKDTGTVTVQGSNTQITSWSDGSATGVLSTAPANAKNIILPITITRKSDSQSSSSICRIGTSQVVLNIAPACRSVDSAQSNGIQNVDFYAIEDQVGGQQIHDKVAIDNQGEIQNLNTSLTAGQKYKISIKAPYSLRKTVPVVAAAGTTVADFTLPLGDIFPVGTGDGTINSLDYGELKREWGNSTTDSSGSRPGDLNNDGVVNSVDYSCMRLFFGDQDDPLPAPTVQNQQTASSSATPAQNK